METSASFEARSVPLPYPTATFATGVKTAGAANSLTAAAMNSPVAMPLSKASQAIMPCHPGTLVTDIFA